MNHTLRITHAMTGVNPIVFIEHRRPAHEVSWTDFDGSLDAPNSLASGSAIHLEYDLFGRHITSGAAATISRSF